MAVDLPRMLLCAEEYRRAAILLEGAPGTPGDPRVVLPMATCNALATELYLKFLYSAQKGREAPHEHDLEKLFGKLPLNIQAMIRATWEHPKPSQLAMRAMIAEVSGEPHPDFDATLKHSAKAFVRIRYSYQYPGEAIIFIGGDIMESARKVIFSLFPTQYAASRLPLPDGVLSQDQAGRAESFPDLHPLRSEEGAVLNHFKSAPAKADLDPTS